MVDFKRLSKLHKDLQKDIVLNYGVLFAEIEDDEILGAYIAGAGRERAPYNQFPTAGLAITTTTTEVRRTRIALAAARATFHGGKRK